MASTKKVVWAALIGNGSIAVMKFTVNAFVPSPALLAEAYHSVADTVNQVFLLISLKMQQRPADEEHPFGYGKSRFFWAFLAAVFIFAAGAVESFRHGFHAWRHPSTEVLEPFWAYVVLGLAFVFEAFACTMATLGVFALSRKMNLPPLQALRRSRDTTLKTALGEDYAAMLGILIAAGGLALRQATGDPRFDAAASMMIGVVLAVVAFGLAWEARKLLIGRSAHPDERATIERLLLEDPAITEVVELLTMQTSPDTILVNAHVASAPDLSADEVATAIERVEDRVREALPAVRRMFLEVQPAGHSSLVRGARKQRAAVVATSPSSLGELP